MTTKRPSPVTATNNLKKAKNKPAKSDEQKPYKNSEDLVIENFEALSQLVESMSETLDKLVQKAESMALHIIATEEILAEIVAENGLNIARVNDRIRSKVASGSENICDADKAIDVAASIASPLPRR